MAYFAVSASRDSRPAPFNITPLPLVMLVPFNFISPAGAHSYLINNNLCESHKDKGGHKRGSCEMLGIRLSI